MADTANSENLVFNLSGDPNHPRCKFTGRLFEIGHGALPFDQQSRNYLNELSPEEKAQRIAAAAALNAATPSGRA
jgi:hypothetical protein